MPLILRSTKPLDVFKAQLDILSIHLDSEDLTPLTTAEHRHDQQAGLAQTKTDVLRFGSIYLDEAEIEYTLTPEAGENTKKEEAFEQYSSMVRSLDTSKAIQDYILQHGNQKGFSNLGKASLSFATMKKGIALRSTPSAPGHATSLGFTQQDDGSILVTESFQYNGFSIRDQDPEAFPEKHWLSVSVESKITEENGVIKHEITGMRFVIEEPVVFYKTGLYEHIGLTSSEFYMSYVYKKHEIENRLQKSLLVWNDILKPGFFSIGMLNPFKEISHEILQAFELLVSEPSDHLSFSRAEQLLSAMEDPFLFYQLGLCQTYNLGPKYIKPLQEYLFSQCTQGNKGKLFSTLENIMKHQIDAMTQDMSKLGITYNPESSQIMALERKRTALLNTIINDAENTQELFSDFDKLASQMRQSFSQQIMLDDMMASMKEKLEGTVLSSEQQSEIDQLYEKIPTLIERLCDHSEEPYIELVQLKGSMTTIIDAILQDPHHTPQITN